MSYVPDIYQARNILGDPAPLWRWSCILPNDITGFTATTITSGSMNSASSNMMSAPTVPFGRVQNMNLPALSLDTDDRFVAGQMVHYPRHITIDELTINFYEDINYNSMNYLNCWRNMVVNKMHNWSPAKKYKKDIYFFAFDHMDNKSPRLVGRIRDCFPTNPAVGLQYEVSESNLVIIPCTFSVGDVELSFTPRAQ